MNLIGVSYISLQVLLTSADRHWL